ncbi:SDR family NAD(P)-dependent oxidoreductase [Aurantimonas sp. MSK8Z-1]|uniref:SDR family NAD(P)-dependent oxidoreductase n=1 Tax=Mangrovibrevibacter kandeliae TaxID=2968473 RepID=UPI002118636B|nr:SDR family NAD(P)-dependent oxidoreductase [Aurantimonas sp. MSK8Z-1]MCW4115207.1 SDR family NAD(P)-dependent oxidoreductase [Aurantimonas sp. MSK8Z-1]
MTRPLAPPPRKDPQRATRPPELPPVQRSRAALGLTARAARGVFALQVCGACGTVAYPPRDACAGCLSTDLVFRPVADGGEVIAQTVIRATPDLYFRERTPWRVGMVRMDCGPSIVAHLHGDVEVPGRCRMVARLDKGGNAVMMARPETWSEAMADDPEWRELTAHPKFRRVLVTAGREPVGQAVAAALSKAGASIVFVGIAEPWKPFAGEAQLRAIPNVQIMPLDLTDTASVHELAGEIGGKTDIIVNTADHVRPGGIVDANTLVAARDSFEVNVFGLQRLAAAFGPGMRSRGADGVNSAAAIVDVLPVEALGNMPGFGFHGASAAARHSLLQCLRAEMRPGGVRVMSVFTGPLDDAWRQSVPPPKVAPAQIARAVVTALAEGIEESFVGDVAIDVAARFAQDPKVLERELGS